jgi:rod shape-determining protein MreB and related proteins
MLNKVLGKFSKDVGIDLGTANTLVYVKDHGIVINEPSVVAINTRTDSLLAVGEDAKRMLGKTPPHIVALHPLSAGVISDFEVTEKMMKYFFDKVHQQTFSFLARPRVIIGIPLGVTEVERKAVEDAALSAGASEVFLIEEPIAAAVGARMPIQEALANMIVDIGGGTTDIAVISLNGVVTSKSLKAAGQDMNAQIISYSRDNFNLLLGEGMAEEIKIKIGSAFPQENILETQMRGRDLLTGLPREVIVDDTQIRDALKRNISQIVEGVKMVIEETPPELVSEIYQRGILLTGGGAALRGLDRLIHEQTQVPVRVADDPLTTVVRGTGVILEDLDTWQEILLPPTSGI